MGVRYYARVDALNLWRNTRRELDSFRRTSFVRHLLRREETGRRSRASIDTGQVPAAPPLPSPRQAAGTEPGGGASDLLGFLSDWCRRLSQLVPTYREASNVVHQMGLPSLRAAFASTVVSVMKLAENYCERVVKTSANPKMSEIAAEAKSLEKLIALLKEILTLNTSSASDTWRSRLHDAEMMEYQPCTLCTTTALCYCSLLL